MIGSKTHIFAVLLYGLPSYGGFAKEAFKPSFCDISRLVVVHMDLVAFVDLELLLGTIVGLQSDFETMGWSDGFQLVNFCFVDCMQ